MKSDILKNEIEKCADMIEFVYNGKYGHIDCYYIPETESEEFLLYFESDHKFEQTVYSIEEVMNTPFLDGKTLKEVAENLDID